MKKALKDKAFKAFLWRKRWDSNPRDLAVYLISSQARYDHFDTLPWPTYYIIPPPELSTMKRLYNRGRMAYNMAEYRGKAGT